MPGKQTVPRRDLLARIVDAEQSRPLVMVNAPAGYGKTTLLSQCFAHWRDQGVITAWYSADDLRFETDQFFAYVMYALYRAGLPLPYAEQALATGLPGIVDQGTARVLLVALENSEAPVRLIIDDYHRIASPVVNAFITHVVERLPAHVSIVLGTRGDSALPVASLKAKGHLLHLDQASLRFTDGEAARFLEPGSPSGKWSGLVRDTEGWPAILQLLRMRGDAHLATLDVRSLVGGSGDLANYLTEQILVDLPSDLQHFLLSTTGVEELCGDLADALTGRTDGATQLELLANRNLLVTPIDYRGGWYRFHPLFAEFLQKRTKRLQPGTALTTHARAARWYGGAQMLSKALHHAAQLPDPHTPLTIMEDAKGWQLALKDGLVPLRNIDNLQLLQAERFPRVWLARCYLSTQDGKAAEARSILNHIGDRLGAPNDLKSTNPVLHIEFLVMEAVTRLFEDRPISNETLAEFAAYLDADHGDAAIDTVVRHLLCIAAYFNDDHVRCQMFGEEALRGARIANIPNQAAYTHLFMGHSRLAQGRVQEAEINLRRSEEQAKRHLGDDSIPLAFTSVLRARACYLQGALESAEQLLTPAPASVERAGAWVDIFLAAYETLVWLHAQKGEWWKSVEVLSTARHLALDRRLSRLGCFADIWETRLQIFFGNLAAARIVFARAEQLAATLPFRTAQLQFAIDLGRALLTPSSPEGPDKATRLFIIRACHSDAITERLEGRILSALQRVTSDPDAAVLDFREALELGENERLPAIIMQFGQALTPLLALAGKHAGALSPSQRDTLVLISAKLPTVANSPPLMVEAGDLPVTQREIDVLRALADGLSSKEIARRLNVAESTVKTHRINIYRKLDVTGRSKAIEAARCLAIL
jgi:LuxR family maltose regulon positive regulatory protein